MNRLDQRFAQLRQANQKGFVAYICAGDPNFEKTHDIVLTLEKCGVDVVEFGVPFSDPVADGIVNQMAADRALKAGATMKKTLECVRKLREETQIPIVLFTYLNPVYAYGFEAFHRDALAAGVDGVLLLDLPPEELRPDTEFQVNEAPASIRLITPTTPEDRLKQIASGAEGFIYYVSREGVTGAQSTIAGGISDQVQRIKAASNTPVAIGFGISNPDQARQVSQMGDAVVVGSAIVKLIEQHGQSDALCEQLTSFVKPLVDAVKSA